MSDLEDPPLLRALVLCAGDDQAAMAEITRAYHGCLEGAKASPFVMSAVLLSAIGNAFLRSATPGNGNGSEALKITTPQFVALKNLLDAQATALKTLPIDLKETLASRGGEHNPDLDAFLEEWRITKAQHQNNRLWDRIARWSFIVVVAAGLIAIACLVTYLLTWRSAQMEANMREARMIAAQPYDQQLPAFLAAHHARIFKGPLAQNQDRPETQGLVIVPGDLKLSNSWVSTNGDTVIPIQ